MGRLIGFMVVCALFASTLPSLLMRTESASREQKPKQASSQTTSVKSSQNPSGEVRLKPDARGHYVAEFKMNGRSVIALVDTGASMVAINKSTARKLGINVSPNDFVHTANTANGTAKMAIGMIREIEIGRVRVRNVEAAILEDRALDGTLLGMSFLKQLEGFTVTEGDLILKQ